jgi:putative ATP-dependent endonuclease of the OLD family
MQALLAHHSTKLKRALSNGLLAIDSLTGGGNLSYKLTLARDAMCVTHALMDHDLSGKEAGKKAIDQGLLTLADLTYTSCLGMTQSELEDWYDATLLAPALDAAFGVLAASAHHTNTKRKWSDRMGDLFIASGKPWDHGVELQVKWKVAETVAASPGKALLAARKSAFDALVGSLEAKLGG